ncbi:MAG: CoA ester lyase [Hyphomicrobiales bacterium]|nr:CoA ester lyase [Hyphomicrobiales bacterium]
MKAPPLLRSVLFCPANEPRKVRRLSAAGADVAVLDLEDAVAVSEKTSARTSAREALAELEGVCRAVRVNAFETGLTAGDVDAVVSADLDVIVLPKVEAAEDLRRIDRLLSRAEAANEVAPGSIRVLALIETCAGISAAAEIARGGGRLLGLAFGAVDLGNDLGLPTLRGDMTAALAYGRAKIVYDARAAGLPPPLDGPFMQVRDQGALEEDSKISRGLGHGGRICIHPDQVPVVNRVFAPDPNEVAFARRAIEAFADAERAGSAAITVDGTFVDYPVVHKARRLLALADAVAKAEGRRPTRT